MHWLEEGAESQTVAELAGQPDLILSDCRDAFQKCLRELGAGASLSEREAAWRYIQTLLMAVKECALAPRDAAHQIVTLERKGIDLFPLRNLAPNGKAYAGEELGIEVMLGLYWALDDVDASDTELAQAAEELKAECQRLLDVFYTNPPQDLDQRK
ncbi:MAG: hypothetical protein H7124_03100 [Phycisphaerales bacterium]|nr:hypothetical protein [Hyphomonadaceae bacterium]